MTATPAWRILDYGVGNLHSLAKALEAAGARVEVSADPHHVAEADVAVLPGVGAFGAVMDKLAPAGKEFQDRHRAGRPTLGICIGAQVMHAASDETLGARGLALFTDTVRRLPANAGKVPHMGWNTLEAPGGVAAAGEGGALADPLFADVAAGSHVYYVHGYAAPVGPATVATTRYGTVFTAALRDGATVGLQFHPEKSSHVGQRILRNAVRLLEAAA